VRSLFGSIIVNATLLGLLLLVHARPDEPKRPGPITIEMIDPPPLPPAAASTGPSSASRSGGGHPNANPSRRARTHVQPAKQSESPWSETVESSEAGIGRGDGTVTGEGTGTGIGFGEGGGVEGSAVPAPPPPPELPPPSRARPAKLRHPARERPVEDDRLYVALVTVDEDGDVVGAHMLEGAPGARGDLAASVIWHFHYEPALDVAGRPVKSTFKQEFQIW
jgi:hypothetical protein